MFFSGIKQAGVYVGRILKGADLPGAQARPIAHQPAGLGVGTRVRDRGNGVAAPAAGAEGSPRHAPNAAISPALTPPDVAGQSRISFVGAHD